MVGVPANRHAINDAPLLCLIASLAWDVAAEPADTWSSCTHGSRSASHKLLPLTTRPRHRTQLAEGWQRFLLWLDLATTGADDLPVVDSLQFFWDSLPNAEQVRRMCVTGARLPCMPLN